MNFNNPDGLITICMKFCLYNNNNMLLKYVD